MMDAEQQIRSAEAERRWQSRRDALLFSKEYGSSAIRSLILVNGGALVALLSFLAQGEVRKELADPNMLCSLYWTFGSFVVGLLSAVTGAGAGYFNFQYWVWTEPNPADLTRYVRDGVELPQPPETLDFRINLSSTIGAIAVAISGLCFLIGCSFALSALVGVVD